MIKMFYSTREKYPASRVDLQDLFSKRVCRQLDIKLDWHMQSMSELAAGNQVVDAAGETVFLVETQVVKVFSKKYRISGLHFCMTVKHGFIFVKVIMI